MASPVFASPLRCKLTTVEEALFFTALCIALLRDLFKEGVQDSEIAIDIGVRVGERRRWSCCRDGIPNPAVRHKHAPRIDKRTIHREDGILSIQRKGGTQTKSGPPTKSMSAPR